MKSQQRSTGFNHIDIPGSDFIGAFNEIFTSIKPNKMFQKIDWEFPAKSR